MSDRPDVLVVGAGPTGLTLAGLLQTMGSTVRIVDRRLDRVQESRALAVQPRTLEVLRGLGVSKTLVDRGNDAAELRLHAGGRVVPIRLFDLGIDDTAFPFVLFISQAETEAILGEALAARGLEVERGVELVSFAAEEDAVTCTLRDRRGRTEGARARYLVGCDGAQSTVRRGAGIPFEGGAYPQTFALGDVEADGDLEPSAVHAFLGASGMLLFFPLGTPATWRTMAVRSPQGARERETATAELPLEELQGIVDSYADGAVTLRDPAWLASFRLHHRQAARYGAGRVLLAGDAAHVHSPAGGQGMNTGIQDAWNLGWKLALVAKGIADETLLDSYEEERLPVGRFVVRFTDRAFAIATSERFLPRLMRSRVAPRVAPLALRLPRVRARAFRTVSQLGIRYRESFAVREGEPTLGRGPRAGDRLPDARIASDGRTGWLQEELAAPVFHLLLCGPAGGWDEEPLTRLRRRFGRLLVVYRLAREAAPDVLYDLHGEAFDRLGIAGVAHYLVRPDGHIGFRAEGTDFEGVEGYLARWLPGAAPGDAVRGPT